jgi:type IV pilus assembly protein PilW
MTTLHPRRRKGSPLGSAKPNSGFSLIELLVALAISIFLFSGALYVFSKTREQYRAIEAVSRIQENARYAMSVLENDLRLAGYWGLHGQSDLVDATSTASASAFCGADFDPTAVNVQRYLVIGVAGSDPTKPTLELPCALNRAANSEALIIRRSSVDPVPPEIEIDSTVPPVAPVLKDNTLYVQDSFVSSLVFKGASVPAPYTSKESNTHVFVTHAYYISAQSQADNNTPALRRISIVPGPDRLDEEIIPGVESMQIELGIDQNGDRTVDLYTSNKALLAGESPLAARITLTLRAQQREQGVGTDNFRRTTLTKTIELRNQRR